MNTPNALAALFNEASDLYSQHHSPIAKIASTSLRRAALKPIIKPSHTVAQCAALDLAYTQTTSPLNTLLERFENQIHWTDTGAGKKPAKVQAKLAFAELIGPNGMVLDDDCRIGLFLQSQDTIYPSHRHAAEELYLVISGTAHWSRQSQPEPILKHPGELIHHPSWEPHAMQTHCEPLLAMWCWAGEIAFGQYELV